MGHRNVAYTEQVRNDVNRRNKAHGKLFSHSCPYNVADKADKKMDRKERDSGNMILVS